ncbi:MAG: polyphosphate polymerase domain-containing protein [Ignavibacteriae bacterium]|nr:polyphosphate polymerase domain-containing protein [Ignavibacteriota bacterium]
MRLEYKYIIPVHLLDEVRRDILPWVTPDAFASRCDEHQYTVRSIYLDTPRFDVYREKVEGFKVRKKIRVRSYDLLHDNSIAFLEIKRKNEQRGTKHRAMLRFADLPELMQTGGVEQFILAGQDLAVSRESARRFMFHVVSASMRPAALVTYEREAYESRMNPSLRITFDKHLRYRPSPAWSNLFDEQGLRHLAPRMFILEIKFNHGFAPWLQSVIVKHNLVRTSVSKYGACIAACYELKSMLPKRLIDRSPMKAHTRMEVIA